MKKKYVFIDLDGTLLDYKTHKVPESAKIALKQARKNGHQLVLATGRPASLLYGIDKELGFDSYIASNGRVVVYQNELIFDQPMPKHYIEACQKICKEETIDLAYEGMDELVLESSFSDLYKGFCDHFNLKYPIVKSGYYHDHEVYKLLVFYDQPDYKRFEQLVPGVSVTYSCEYGLDVNSPGGSKELGIQQIMNHCDVPLEDVIAIGDGYNDISMLEYATISVAMGNAFQGVEEHATFQTDDIDNDGLFKAFQSLKLI